MVYFLFIHVLANILHIYKYILHFFRSRLIHKTGFLKNEIDRSFKLFIYFLFYMFRLAKFTAMHDVFLVLLFSTRQEILFGYIYILLMARQNGGGKKTAIV